LLTLLLPKYKLEQWGFACCKQLVAFEDCDESAGPSSLALLEQKQILTQKAQFTRFTGTNVEILTQKALQELDSLIGMLNQHLAKANAGASAAKPLTS
jgi:hypothetical protein